MFKRTKTLLTIVVLGASAFLSCGTKEGEAPAPTATAPPPLLPGVTQNLTKNSAPPLYNFDNLGPITFPVVQKSNQISGDADTAVSGWALDPTTKTAAGGVDVVIDQTPHSARYGVVRQDVADHFKCPDCLASGFLLTVGRGQLAKGPHTVSVRVISGDKKSYNEGPVVPFTVN